jgi:hypothetical protein
MKKVKKLSNSLEKMMIIKLGLVVKIWLGIILRVISKMFWIREIRILILRSILTMKIKLILLVRVTMTRLTRKIKTMIRIRILVSWTSRLRILVARILRGKMIFWVVLVIWIRMLSLVKIFKVSLIVVNSREMIWIRVNRTKRIWLRECSPTSMTIRISSRLRVSKWIKIIRLANSLTRVRINNKVNNMNIRICNKVSNKTNSNRIEI